MALEEIKRDLDFLPEAMVEEMLSKQKEVIKRIGANLQKLSSLKAKVREALLNLGVIRDFADVVRQKSYPTTVGVDGTRSRIMQLSMDTAAVAAVAVEGLVPPREEKIWPKPHHIVKIFQLEHSPVTDELLRGLMFSCELELACKAPHRVVMLDGSYTSILVATGQCLKQRHNGPEELRNEVESRIKQTLENFRIVLTSPKVDQIFVALPKYTERKEVISLLQTEGLTDPILERIDDRGLLTICLKSQEFIGPLHLQKPESPWHLTGVPEEHINIREEIINAMNELHVVYIKPSPVHPVLRAEIGRNIAIDERKLFILLQALLEQTVVPGIFEPYPLYIADVFVKHVHGSLLELREAAVSDMSRVNNLNLTDYFLLLHDYRSREDFE